MPTLQQPFDQHRPDRAASPHDQDPHHDLPGTWPRALVSGASASILSTALVCWLSRRNTGSACGGTNATSQWVWGEPARLEDRPSLRHTALGYVIHHASAVFWATLFETATEGRQPPGRIAGAALATAGLAYVVDYHVVPRRLSPGYEGRTGGAGLAGSYLAAAAGLCLGRLLLEGVSGHRPAPPSGRRVRQRAR